MSHDTIPQHGSYADRPPIKMPAWHATVAWDMLCNGLSTGLFLVMAVGELTWPSLFAQFAPWAYPLALLFLLTDLTLLVIDLGDPWRFHHMLRMFKPGSPMSVGVWSLTIYSLPLTLIVLVDLLLGAGPRGLHIALLVIGIPPALAAAVYKGVLLSTSAQPGWNKARWLGGYQTSGALGLGAAVLIILAMVLDQPEALAVLRTGLVALLVIQVLPMILLIHELNESATCVFPRNRTLVAALAATGLVPLALAVANTGAWMLPAAATLIVIGNLVSRYLLVQLPHSAA